MGSRRIHTFTHTHCRSPLLAVLAILVDWLLSLLGWSLAQQGNLGVDWPANWELSQEAQSASPFSSPIGLKEAYLHSCLGNWKKNTHKKNNEEALQRHVSYSYFFLEQLPSSHSYNIRFSDLYQSTPPIPSRLAYLDSFHIHTYRAEPSNLPFPACVSSRASVNVNQKDRCSSNDRH